MAVILQLDKSTPFVGIQSFTYTVLAVGAYEVGCQSTLPASSGLEIEIKLNGTPVETFGGASDDPSPSQQSLGGNARILCAASDVISVVLTSSAASDSVRNAVKGIINLYQTI